MALWTGWKSKPPQGTPLDPTQGIIRNLVALWPFNEGSGLKSIASDSRYSATLNSFTWGSTTDTSSGVSNGTSSTFVPSLGVSLIASTSFTYLWRGILTSSNFASYPGFWQANASSNDFCFISGTSGCPHTRINGNDILDPGTPSLPSGRIVSFFLVWRDGNVIEYWWDGVIQASASATGVHVDSQTITTFGYSSSSNGYLQANWSLQGWWNRDLLASEIEFLTNNPWQLFASPIPWWLEASSGGTTTFIYDFDYSSSTESDISFSLPYGESCSGLESPWISISLYTQELSTGYESNTISILNSEQSLESENFYSLISLFYLDALSSLEQNEINISIFNYDNSNLSESNYSSIYIYNQDLSSSIESQLSLNSLLDSENEQSIEQSFILIFYSENSSSLENQLISNMSSVSLYTSDLASGSEQYILNSSILNTDQSLSQESNFISELIYQYDQFLSTDFQINILSLFAYDSSSGAEDQLLNIISTSFVYSSDLAFGAEQSFVTNVTPTLLPCALILTGPTPPSSAHGAVEAYLNQPVGPFTVQPTQFLTGTVYLSDAATNIPNNTTLFLLSSGTFEPPSLTFNYSNIAQQFYYTPTVMGLRPISISSPQATSSAPVWIFTNPPQPLMAGLPRCP